MPSVLQHTLRLTPIGELIAHPANARKHLDAAIDESIEKNGFYKPVVASSASGYVLAGNGTVARAKAAGMTELPVYFLDGLSALQEERILSSDNRTSDLSPGYDNVALADLLTRIAAESDGSLAGTGYSQEAFDAVVAAAGDAVLEAAGGAPVEEAEEPQIDRAEELLSKWKVKSGDIWQIGAHRLMCGDSTDAEAVAGLLNGVKVALGLHDPPYGISYKFADGGKFGNAVAPRSVFSPIQGDDKPFDPAHVLELSSIVILWGANHYADKLPARPSWIVWDKRVDMPSNQFSDCELAWVSDGGSARIIRHKWMGMIRDSERGEKRIHPTQKPVAVQSEIIQRYSKTGECVLDLYAGSGSTLVACEQVGRTSYNGEIEPKYCAVILERMSKLGLTPELSS